MAPANVGGRPYRPDLAHEPYVRYRTERDRPLRQHPSGTSRSLSLRPAQNPSERNSMKAKNVWHHRKTPHAPSFRALKRAPGDGEAAVGRTAYLEEYQRDRGPDLDEPLDRTESENEF